MFAPRLPTEARSLTTRISGGSVRCSSSVFVSIGAPYKWKQRFAWRFDFGLHWPVDSWICPFPEDVIESRFPLARRVRCLAPRDCGDECGTPLLASRAVDATAAGRRRRRSR
jgi:hypothetical protein